MLRFLWLSFAFLFPFIIFAFYAKLCDIYGKKRARTHNMISTLIITGLLLCGLLLISLRIFSGDIIASGTFVPAYEKDGKIISSHFQ